ncbi:MAG: hypothetical protein LUE31_12875, partial [Lachnospiraceae bacterium]|nr:hypothetical protein [Lachnospiraceae bacterium]
MGEKPGESKFGRVLMAVLPFALLTSGTSLVGGSASGNVSSINYMLNNAGLELTYVHWAKLAYPAFIICIIPGILLFTRFFKFKAEDVHILPADYYQERLDELGPIGGSEVRWIIIIIGMIACMLGGMKTAYAALLWAMISVLPGIGVADAKKVIPALNWDVCICVCIVPLLGTILTNNGVNDFIAAKIGPLFSNLGIFPFMVLAGWIMFVLMNVMVNATHGAHALTAATLIPIAVSLGYNPLVVCFPMLCTASWFYCFGGNYIVMINGGYGWWDKKDTIIPGLITGLCMVVAYSAIIYVIAPLWGMSFYL